MNTKITYRYRDASNNKAEGAAVLRGTADSAVLISFIESLAPSGDPGIMGFFVPGQIGLPDLQDRFSAQTRAILQHLVDQEPVTTHAEVIDAAFSETGTDASWYPDDGPWHEVLEITSTPEMPTLQVTFAELTEVVGATSWDPDYRPTFDPETIAPPPKTVNHGLSW